MDASDEVRVVEGYAWDCGFERPYTAFSSEHGFAQPGDEPALLVIGSGLTAEQMRAALRSRTTPAYGLFLDATGADHETTLVDLAEWLIGRGTDLMRCDPDEAGTEIMLTPEQAVMCGGALQSLARSPGGAEGWRPIETAPKDGSKVLATDGTHVWACWWDAEFEAQWDDERADREPDYSGHWEQRWTDGRLTVFGLVPTHWMPYPAAPTEDQPEGDDHE